MSKAPPRALVGGRSWRSSCGRGSTDSEIDAVTSRACAQGDEQLIQLRERLDRRIRRPGAGSIESFLRGIQLVHGEERLAILFLEGHRGDGTVFTFFIGPDEARVRYHFLVCTE